MRRVLTTIAELAGMSAIAVGFGLIWLPLGLIAAGCGLIVVGVTSA